MYQTNQKLICRVRKSRKELLSCPAQGNETDCFLNRLIAHFKALTEEIDLLVTQAAKAEDLLLDSASASERTHILIDHDGQLRVRSSAWRRCDKRPTTNAQIKRIEMHLKDTESKVNSLKVELCDIEEMILFYKPKTILGGLRKSRILLEIVAADQYMELDHYLAEIYDAVCLSEEIAGSATSL